MAKPSQESLAEKVSRGSLKDLLIDGKVDECGVILQIVYLKMDGNEVEMELSDTINKTRPFQMHFSRPQEFKLYMVLKVLFGVVRNEIMESAERYKLIVKGFKLPVEEIGMILGDPKYFEAIEANQDHKVVHEKNLAQQSISILSTTTCLALETIDEEDELLLNISDEIVGMSPEKKKENDRNIELLKYIKRDMIAYENEKLTLMKKNQFLLNQFQFFQKKKKEIDNRIASAQNELLAVDAELEDIVKSISELEAKKVNLLQ